MPINFKANEEIMFRGRIKKILKNIGMFFIVLTQVYENDACQNVLLVDGGFIPPNNFALIVNGVKAKFTDAHITILTFEDKREFIKNNFPDAEIIIPDERIRPKRHRLAIRLFSLLRKRFKFIVISSLDIPIVLLSLFFGKCPVLLHNRWLQWYKVRQRTILDILRMKKSADSGRRRTSRGIKGVLKNIGRAFVLLSEFKGTDIKRPVLIVDNGYTDISHVSNAMRKVSEEFLNPDITLLTLAFRKSHFANMFPEIKIIAVNGAGNRYGLAAAEYRLRKLKFFRVVLTALDISPVLISLLFMKAEVILYNKWHQWWGLRFKKIWEYPKGILKPIVTFSLIVYLFISSGIILFRTAFRLKFNHPLKESE